MSETNTPFSIPACGWQLTPARHNGYPIYYHTRRDELAFEDIQEARLVKLPAVAEQAIRSQLTAETA